MTRSVILEERVDEHHREVLAKLPTDLLDFSDLGRVRQAFNALPRPVPDPRVTIEEHNVPGWGDDPDVAVRVYVPPDPPASGPAFYWVHGGGMVLGSAEHNDAQCAEWALELGAIVCSVDYRLAPEHPFPAPLHDCHAGLVWFAASADRYGFDPTRLGIGGASAGGGLAAGTALFSRDNDGPALCFQLLVYPMLDHRNDTPSSHAITDPRVWHRAANEFGWSAYVGDGPVSPYASPSLATDLAGLPPAYIPVGDLDLFLDEDVAYAHALLHAGVPCELHVYPGLFHGSPSFVPNSPTTRRWLADERAALLAGLGG